MQIQRELKLRRLTIEFLFLKKSQELSLDKPFICINDLNAYFKFQKNIIQNIRGFYLTQIISYLGKSGYLDKILAEDLINKN